MNHHCNGIYDFSYTVTVMEVNYYYNNSYILIALYHSSIYFSSKAYYQLAILSYVYYKSVTYTDPLPIESRQSFSNFNFLRLTEDNSGTRSVSVTDTVRGPPQDKTGTSEEFQVLLQDATAPVATVLEKYCPRTATAL